MKATNEQILNAAAIILAGAMSGDNFSKRSETRLKYTGEAEVKDAIRIAKMIADNIEEK